MVEYANPALARANASAPVIVTADPASCTIQFDPIGKAEYTSSCDIAKAALAQAGVGYTSKDGAAGTLAVVHVGQADVAGVDANAPDAAGRKAERGAFEKQLRSALDAAGYPEKADPARVDKRGLFCIMFWFILCATALYGPMAASLVELFPTRIRYSALSLPYMWEQGGSAASCPRPRSPSSPPLETSIRGCGFP